MEPVSTARGLIKDVLLKHKGRAKPETIDMLADEIANSISHLLTFNTDVKAKKMGATVMTESASADYGSRPRSF
jgi:hypothetical protein